MDHLLVVAKAALKEQMMVDHSDQMMVAALAAQTGFLMADSTAAS